MEGMILSKAQEILADLEHYEFNPTDLDAPAAIRLGAEAIKRLRLMRTYPMPMAQHRLPTEDFQ